MYQSSSNPANIRSNMDKVNKPKMKPQIPEPTEVEIQETIRKIESKHSIILSHTDATRFAKLTNELKWWLEVEKAAENPKVFDDEMIKTLANDLKDTKAGKNAKKTAKISLEYAIAVEKKRILGEMKKIIEKY